MRSRALTVACVLAGGLVAGEARAPDRSIGNAASPRPAWTEVEWPFPFDAWPAGRAFRCGAGACGTEVSVYIRPKVGFCNCSVGVADDDEIDRVGDLVLLSERYRPAGEGRPVAIGTMQGRARAFLVEPARHAIGLAVSKKCDALVAAVVSDRPIARPLERAVFDLLNGEPIVGWAEASVGL